MRPECYSSKTFLRSKKKMFVRTFESSNEDCIRSLLPLHCPQVAATQTSAVGVRWKLQLPSRGIETTVTARSLLNDLLKKPARALTDLGALQNHGEGRRKVKSMPTWVNLSQGGSTLHSSEATGKRASTTSAGVRGKDPQRVVSGRRAKNLAEILSSYKKTEKPTKRHERSQWLSNLRRKRQGRCRVRVRRVRSSKRLKKMRRRSRLLEMRRRSRFPEMMTMKTKLRRHRFQIEGHCRGHGFPSNRRTSGERGGECRFRS